MHALISDGRVWFVLLILWGFWGLWHACRSPRPKARPYDVDTALGMRAIDGREDY